MYTKYFGFNEKPFTLTPNPRFIFLSKNHKEAFAHLLYGINNHYGFIELTGEIGTGKTTVLRTLLGQLQDENYRTALIFSPCLSGVELLHSIVTEFGIDCKSQHSNELLAELNRFLLAETAEGRTVVLVIDEAQNLQPEVLEQVRMISNLETENDKLIQIILAGQPELENLLGRPDLRQLNQRIAVRYKLRSMSLHETYLYIRQRMEVAGETGGVSFTDYAVKWLYLSSRGVPRIINILCDRALLIAYGDERRKITSGIIFRSMWEIFNSAQRRKLVAVCSFVIICVVLLAVLAAVGLTDMPTRAKPSNTLNSPNPVLSTTHQKSSALENEISSYDQNDTHITVFNTLAELWMVRPLRDFSEDLDIPVLFSRLAAKRNLRLTRFHGSLDDVLRFELPFIAVTKVSGGLGEYCYAITSANQKSLSISPTLFDSHTISRNEFNTVSNGVYYLLWRNYAQIPDFLIKGHKGQEIRALQQYLKQAGFYQDAINGVYSNATITSVRRFQNSLGLATDDALGELTLSALSRFDKAHKTKALTNMDNQ